MKKSLVFILGMSLTPMSACETSSHGGGERQSPLPQGKTAAEDPVTKDSVHAHQIYPERLYSGFDGRNRFQVPVMYVGDSNVTWSASDPSMVSLVPDPKDASRMMITTKKAGSVTIMAQTSQGLQSVPLQIYAYSPEDTAAGQTRFQKGPDAKNPACNTCHRPGGRGGDNTPTDIGRQTDEATAETYISGRSPEGTILTVSHVWQVTEREEIGLMAYLRSQTPKGWPDPAEDERQEKDRDD